MATIRLENVDKIYENGVQAVFDFNINISDKEFILRICLFLLSWQAKKIKNKQRINI